MFYTDCYPKNDFYNQEQKHVNIEGPEFDLDFSFFLTNMSREIAAIE